MLLQIYAAISCSELTAPTNGEINYNPDTTPNLDFGTVATFSCNNGLGLSGGDVSITCGGDGSNTTGIWGGTVPTCERKLAHKAKKVRMHAGIK